MVTFFAIALREAVFIRRRPLVWGAVYGLGLYLLMYWLVLPLRFSAYSPKLDLWPLGNALFSHVVCVGLPIAFVLTRVLDRANADRRWRRERLASGDDRD